VTAGAAPAASRVCHSCGQPVGATDSFCESCGAELAPPSVSDGAGGGPQVCESCSSSRITADGFCESCGHRARSGRDHQEVGLGLVAGVTDRGLRHHRNEDAMALATVDTAATAAGPAVVAVVCDGVSTSARPDEASLVAARAAARVLLAGVRTGTDPAETSAAAVRAAIEAVTALAGPPEDPPAATFVSAVLTAGAATVCWLGDSRAYWLAADPDAAEQLTTDDSLAEEMVAAGLLSEEDALASAHGHVVTRWIGADLGDPEPHVVRFEPPGPGALLLCSDGLWNYQPEAAGLAGLALPAALTDPLGAARTLVSFALAAGGGDNVTAVLAPFSPAQPAAGPPPAPESPPAPEPPPAPAGLT
jgi:serine/threonine protein phosphatase PrpC